MYIRIALRASKVSYSDIGEGGVAVSCEKPNFSLTPCTYIRTDRGFKKSVEKGKASLCQNCPLSVCPLHLQHGLFASPECPLIFAWPICGSLKPSAAESLIFLESGESEFSNISIL